MTEIRPDYVRSSFDFRHRPMRTFSDAHRRTSTRSRIGPGRRRTRPGPSRGPRHVRFENAVPLRRPLHGRVGRRPSRAPGALYGRRGDPFNNTFYRVPFAITSRGEQVSETCVNICRVFSVR